MPKDKNLKINKFFLILAALFIFLCPSASHAGSPIRILIVPGHDDTSPGAVYHGLRETDMNLKLGLMLYDELQKDKNYEVFITRGWSGYKKEFADYFRNNKSAIRQFITDSENNFNSRILSGEIKKFDGVWHQKASPEMEIKLYGISRWADENNIDALIHIHFNDYAPRNPGTRGIFSGFAVYAPEPQMKNSAQSMPLGASIFSALRQYYNPSNNGKESWGLVPDQKLIATGKYDTLKTRSVLIEYGYIYEERFSTWAKREAERKIMARQTYEGIKNYFESIAPTYPLGL